MSESTDPVAAPRDRETALSTAYLRLLGHTQQEAAKAAGLDPRTVQRWEHSSWWPGVKREAADRWLSGLAGRARKALLEALERPDGPLALKVLERIVPELAPPSQRVELRGALANLDMSKLAPAQVARIPAGEHPLQVLASAVEPETLQRVPVDAEDGGL